MAASMSSYVSDYILGQDDTKSAEIAREIFKKNATLVEVVEKMGEHLTSTSVEPRRRGTQLLADIMQKLPADFLTEKEVGHVSAFFISKLGDHHSIQPFALHGLAAVTTFKSFHDASTSQLICSEIFKEVQNQTLAQIDRRATYTVFLNLLTTHLADIQTMGDNFACGYIQQMDGEKDPRNLMLAFRCSVLICQNFPLGAMEEDMFEVNSCYFPIDFVPPPSDPHGITRENLRDALCSVMAASPSFAKYCYPLLQEKLSSDVPTAKLDVIKALVACLPVYETRHLQEHLGPLCTQIIREVRAGTDELLSLSLQCMAVIAAQLSRVPQQLQEFMAETGSDLVRQVESENLTLRFAAVRILSAMAGANSDVCHAVAARLVPAVCGVFQNIAQPEQHTHFFSAVTSFLQHVADSQKADLDWGMLRDWRSKLVDMCDGLLSRQDPQHQVLGVQGLCALAGWNTVLSAEETAACVVKVVSKALLADSNSFREECRNALSKVIKRQLHLADNVISLLRGVLHNCIEQGADNEKLENGAGLLTAVAVDDVTSDKVCQIFLQILQAYRPGLEESLVSLSQGLAEVLAGGLLAPELVVSVIVPSILRVVSQNPGFAAWPEDKKQLHATVLTKLAEGLCRLVLLLDTETCTKVVDMVCKSVMAGEDGGGDKATPLKSFSQWQMSRLVQLLLAVSPCLNVKDTAVTEPLLSTVTDLALLAEDDYTCSQACRCVAALVNRMPAGDSLDHTVSNLTARLSSRLTGPTAIDLQKKSLTLLIWLTKAMVVRGHKTSAELTAKLLDFLPNPTLGAFAAEGFHTVMASCSDVLQPTLRAVVSPTFQQRFIVQNLPPLLAGFQNAVGEVKENYLLAVAGMLSSVPTVVLVTELPQLMPILASSLKGKNSSLHVQALTTLLAGLKHAPDLLTTYLSDILPDCLTLCSAGSHMRVRILALQCVGEMVHLQPIALQPHKSLVTRSLKIALDDRKRLVRKQAVLASSAWCLL